MKELSMRHFYRFFAPLPFLLCLGVVALVSGCSKSEPGTATGSTSDKKSRSNYVIGMSQCNLGEPWRVEMNAQIQAAADKHPNLKVIFKDAQNDTLKQRAHVEEFVSAGVDLIIISPKEAQPLTAPVAKAMDAGIPVIVLDRRLIGDKYTCFIGADNK
ncbi:MAG TPA: substrate-binding domain-containing protein, partial [Verrucomicrobiae bacterium]|nr:substrate-binding domain-containing protein [Verrucomicrobiae bacterium]